MRFSVAYRPLYFLAALGMGGLSVSFFVYLMFLIPHPGSPIPHLSHVLAAYRDGTVPSRVFLSVILGLTFFFAVRHYQVLIANIRAYRAFTRTPEYVAFRASNAEISLMAIPLTLGMSVNVAFVVGALAIPGMWAAKEYLFPVALLAMTGIAGYALVVFGRYLTRILVHKGFDIEDTNHFSQVLPSFAFAMIAVGYSSSAAMSSTKPVVVIGLVGTFIFLAAAAAWILVKLPVAFAGMLRHGMAVEAGPTLWLGIPIMTLVGITVLRDVMGTSHTLLHATVNPVVWFVFFGLLVAAQLVMGLFGYAIMRRQAYFATYVTGPRRSVAAYGLICPGVALSVLLMFFIHWGLVEPGIIARDSVPHYGLVAVVALVQLVTIRTLTILNRKLMGGQPAGSSSLEPAVAAVAPV
ncbi:MAG: hypothetical protein M9891_06415 [Austwickia sp.]|nr:hypothetical protein [Actinomycetota bacterium]MCB1252635.1 hypothetical protein [Austwickia sp.]MCO5308908.1 hypothetical protein [Austwickia sp.]